MRSLLLPVTILSVASIRIGISLALVSLCSSRVNCQSDTTNMAKLFHLRQSINVPGIRALGLLFQSPSMLLPHIHIDRIDQLDVVQLKEKHGIRCIVFDKDNTLR